MQIEGNYGDYMFILGNKMTEMIVIRNSSAAQPAISHSKTLSLYLALTFLTPLGVANNNSSAGRSAKNPLVTTPTILFNDCSNEVASSTDQL